MDNRTPTPTEIAPLPDPTGCCGGARDAKPQAEVEPQPAQTETVKPMKSGCGCGYSP